MKVTPTTILLYLPSFIPGIVSTSLIFPFTYMCTQHLLYIHPPVPFPHHFPLSTGSNTPRQDLFWPSLLFSDFVKEKKKMTFLFV
jgi:hypothetical protein